jgi:CheY-like chemotaxis protein
LIFKDAETRALYRDALARADCVVDAATDGRDALAKAFPSPPSLVITTSRFRSSTGTLCDISRRDPPTTGVPILVVTAAEPAERVERIAIDALVLSPRRLTRSSVKRDDSSRRSSVQCPFECDASRAARFSGSSVAIERTTSNRLREGAPAVHDDIATEVAAGAQLSVVRPRAEIRTASYWQPQRSPS